jgi:alpha-1,2-mannosyltransferase
MTYSATAAWLGPRLWIGLVAGMVPWIVWIGGLALNGWYKDYQGTLIGADHLAFYTAARLIRDGEQERMYDYRENDNRELGDYERKLIGWEWGGFEAYRNPPFYALLYWPTAGLSFYLSLLIWTAIGFHLFALSIWLLRPRRPSQVLLWSLVFYPLFTAISFGQNTLLSLAIFAGVYRLLKNDRRFPAGLVAGLLWFKPQLLLGLFIWWAFSPRKYIRCWLGVFATGLLLAAISWGALPKASLAFVENIKTIIGFRGFGLWNVHNPKAFIELLLPVNSPLIDDISILGGLVSIRVALIWFLTLLVSTASVLIAWRIYHRTGAGIAAMFPAAVFLSLWASPHALIYEWTLLISACVVLWEEYADHRDAWLCLFVLTWIGLTISTPFASVQVRELHLECVLQVSVPIMGLVGYLTARELLNARSRTEQK